MAEKVRQPVSLDRSRRHPRLKQTGKGGAEAPIRVKKEAKGTVKKRDSIELEWGDRWDLDDIIIY